MTDKSTQKPTKPTTDKPASGGDVSTESTQKPVRR